MLNRNLQRRDVTGRMLQTTSTPLLLLALPVHLPNASQAVAPSALQTRRSQVVLGQRVTLQTMRLRRIDSRAPRAPQNVRSVGNGLEMGRIAARPVAAEMIERETARDGADQQFVDTTMGHPCDLLSVDRYGRVRVPVGVPRRPRPTLRGEQPLLKLRNPVAKVYAPGFAALRHEINLIKRAACA